MQSANSAKTLGTNTQLQDWRDARVMVFQGQYFTLKDQPDQRYDLISIGEIMALLESPANVEKESAWATIGSSYNEYDARSHEVQKNQGSYWLLRFDIDTGNPSLEDVCEAFTFTVGDKIFMVYSTSSATATNRRWRVLVPLLVPVHHELRRETEVFLRETLSMLWGLKFDPALDRAGQHIYLPAVAQKNRGHDGEPLFYEWKRCGDTPLDIEHSPWFPAVQSSIEKLRQEESERQEALKDKCQRRVAQSHSAGPHLSAIDWYNQVHPLENVLSEAGYIQSPSDDRDWASPLQTTSSYATRVYDSYFVSLSGSDAQAGIGAASRSGARVGDAFSIFMHFMHAGDRASALEQVRTLRKSSEQITTLQTPEMVLPAVTPIMLQELKQARLTPRVIVEKMLYADVRLRIGPGGSSKTTLAVYEAVTLALGRSLWGRPVASAVRSLFITREDSRETLVARIRSVMQGLLLDESEQAAALQNIRVMDLTDISFRLSAVQNDVVIPHRKNLANLIESLDQWKPDWLICDPLVSFGVGESRVNDAEQGLIEAFRILRNQLGCCTEGIHHTGKAVARDKILDQYSGRGGSALADGARMVVVTQPLDPKQWTKATGTILGHGETGFVMAFPKLSYCRPQPPIFIRRSGFSFQMQEGLASGDPDAVEKRDADLVYEFLTKHYDKGRRYSSSELDKVHDEMGLTRTALREACGVLKTQGRVVYNGKRGRVGSYFEPVVVKPLGDDCD